MVPHRRFAMKARFALLIALALPYALAVLTFR